MPVSGFEHHTMECGDIERRLVFTREKQSISPSHRRKIERVVKMARPHLHICDGDRSCRVHREERCDAQEARRESRLAGHARSTPPEARHPRAEIAAGAMQRIATGRAPNGGNAARRTRRVGARA
jgi:hypothetical protein